jgi:peptide deformylase
VDEALRTLIDDMFESMYASKGIGLAATQVNVHRRLLVVDVSEEHDQPLVLVNPEVVSREEVGKAEEGCLSVPGIYDEVERAQRIRVRALGRDGRPFEMQADGLLAVCIQHEIDHLDGKLFVDYLSELKRQRIRKKLDKDRKQRPAGREPARSSAPAI